MNKVYACRYVQASLNGTDHNQFTFPSERPTFTPSFCKFDGGLVKFTRYRLIHNSRNLESIIQSIEWTEKRIKYWNETYWNPLDIKRFYFMKDCEYPVYQGYKCEFPFVENSRFEVFYENFFPMLRNTNSNETFERFNKNIMRSFLQEFNKADPSLSAVISKSDFRRWLLGIFNADWSWYSFFNSFMLQVCYSFDIATNETHFIAGSNQDENLVSLVENLAEVNIQTETWFYWCSVKKKCEVQEFTNSQPLCFECDYKRK